jgi:hypothetical protein
LIDGGELLGQRSRVDGVAGEAEEARRIPAV